jgi:predicted esterase
MNLQAIEVETAPNPVASIVILHGLGADGNDFVSLVDELDLKAVGPVRFVFPHAPTRPVTRISYSGRPSGSVAGSVRRSPGFGSFVVTARPYEPMW